MSNNTELNPGSGGVSIRDIDKSGFKTQVVVLDLGGSGAESLLTGTLPVSLASAPLPTDAAKETKQDTGNTSVASIDTKTPALGQALAAGSSPVVLTAAQLTTLTPPAAITGYALEAGHLAAIDTSTAKIPSQGQALAAASMPVVLTAAQLTTLTPPAAITGYALEAGNLATIAAKDFATQTTLALVKAKTDNLDVALSTKALESGGNLASVKTNTDPLVAAAAGGYVRQDSTATIAKETGGNLATLASAVKTEDSLAVDLDKGIPSLAVRQDVPVTDTSVSMDYSFIKTDYQGRIWVNSDVLAGIMRAQNELLADIRTELKILNVNTSSIGNVRDDLDQMRSDPYYNQ